MPGNLVVTSKKTLARPVLPDGTKVGQQQEPERSPCQGKAYRSRLEARPPAR